MEYSEEKETHSIKDPGVSTGLLSLSKKDTGSVLETISEKNVYGTTVVSSDLDSDEVPTVPVSLRSFIHKVLLIRVNRPEKDPNESVRQR